MCTPWVASPYEPPEPEENISPMFWGIGAVESRPFHSSVSIPDAFGTPAANGETPDESAKQLLVVCGLEASPHISSMSFN